MLICVRAGVRFRSNKGDVVDVLYENIRHAIMQPCEKEHIALIHLHLRHAILVGKKKYKDVQFFTDVIAATEDTNQRNRSDFDADGFQEEANQRRLRDEVNNAFRRFAKYIEEAAEKVVPGFSFEVPTPDLGFPYVLLCSCARFILSLPVRVHVWACVRVPHTWHCSPFPPFCVRVQWLHRPLIHHHLAVHRLPHLGC